MTVFLFCFICPNLVFQSYQSTNCTSPWPRREGTGLNPLDWPSLSLLSGILIFPTSGKPYPSPCPSCVAFTFSYDSLLLTSALPRVSPYRKCGSCPLLDLWNRHRFGLGHRKEEKWPKMQEEWEHEHVSGTLKNWPCSLGLAPVIQHLKVLVKPPSSLLSCFWDFKQYYHKNRVEY